MILEFAEKQYVDIDNVVGLRWIKADEQEYGVIILQTNKIGITEKAEFDIIEQAFIWKHKTNMYNDKMKRVRYTKRELQEGE